jgi:hypothetical protein
MPLKALGARLPLCSSLRVAKWLENDKEPGCLRLHLKSSGASYFSALEQYQNKSPNSFVSKTGD